MSVLHMHSYNTAFQPVLTQRRMKTAAVKLSCLHIISLVFSSYKAEELKRSLLIYGGLCSRLFLGREQSFPGIGQVEGWLLILEWKLNMKKAILIIAHQTFKAY